MMQFKVASPMNNGGYAQHYTYVDADDFEIVEGVLVFRHHNTLVAAFHDWTSVVPNFPMQTVPAPSMNNYHTHTTLSSSAFPGYADKKKPKEYGAQAEPAEKIVWEEE